jgi:uncharacterized oxidoreductase
MQLDHLALVRLASEICSAAGAPHQEAGTVAESLVEANLQGHDSHGVGMLPIYIRNINKGFLQPDAHVRTISASDNLLLLDGQSGFGQVVGPEAMELAIERARDHGVCVMGLKNAHHLGRIGGLGEQAASAGLISLHYVNVVGHNPLVAPFGGAQARMNTNPFCCAIPMQDPSAPLVFDMATSTIALGKARVAHNSGDQVAEGCLVDHQGLPTRDPAVMFTEPLGAMTYLGQHKGFGLALICELLAGALVGHWTAQDEHPRPMNVINHMLTIVLDPAAFEKFDDFVAEAEKFVAYIKATTPAVGTESVLIPGDPERKEKRKRLQHGIPVDPGTWQQLLDTAASVGISEAACRSLAG